MCLGWSASKQEVVSKMSGFGIVYTLDMGPDQLLPSKIHTIVLVQAIKLPNFGTPR